MVAEVIAMEKTGGSGGDKTTTTNGGRPQAAGERNKSDPRPGANDGGHRRNKTLPGTIDSGPNDNSQQSTAGAVQLQATTRTTK